MYVVTKADVAAILFERPGGMALIAMPLAQRAY
jgi:hypothetical protein